MAKPGLDALRIAAGGRSRCQKRVPVRKPAGPVELLAEQVLMVEVPPRLGAWEPQAQRLFADLTRAVEVAGAGSHPEAVAHHSVSERGASRS